MATVGCPPNCCLLLVLFLHGVSLGFLFSVLGPCLPDMQCLYGVDLSVVSTLFIFYCLGGITIQVLSGNLLQRLSSPFPLLCGCVFLQGVAYMLLPFAGTIYLAAFLVFLIGMTTFFGLCGILFVFQINWPGNFRMVHLIFTMSAIGAVAGPLLVNPFISDGVLTKQHGADLWHLTANVQGRLTSGNVLKGPVPLHLHDPEISLDSFTATSEETSTVTPLHHTESNVTETELYESGCQHFITLIHFPYMLISFIHLPSIIGYVYFSFKARYQTETSEYKSFDNEDSLKKVNAIYFVLVFLLLIQAQGLPSGFSALLTTYGMKHIQLSMSRMALMTSLFWFTFTIGRLIGSLLPTSVEQVYIVSTSMVGNSVGVVMLTSTLYGHETTLWIASLILGLFTAPFASAGLSWSDQLVGSTPKMKGLFIVAVLVGFLVPSLFGFIMKMYGIAWFVYCFVAFQVFNVAIFVSLLLYIKTN